VATAGASSEPAAAPAQSCTPKSNVEAIVDDSQSMSFTDPSRLRLRALELFIDNPGNEGRTLGAIEFGTDAEAIFPAMPIGQSRASMKALLGPRIAADNGATDYNDAFNFAAAHNPNATGRIFLTDGEHTDDPAYADAHRGGPPVYVIGLGVLGDGAAVLQRIATDTGGTYRLANTAGELQAAMFDLNSVIGCLAAPITFKNSFSKANQVKSRAVTVPAGIRSVNVALSWSDERDAFDVSGFRVVRRGKVVAKGAAVRRLRVTKRRGATFVTVKVSRLVRGRLSFKLRSRRIATPGASVELTTQLARSRRR
jgi:hypothetical protein